MVAEAHEEPIRHTTVSRVHAELRERILSGQIAPGAWLRQEELAASLAVSRMPVREALALLRRLRERLRGDGGPPVPPDA